MMNVDNLHDDMSPCGQSCDVSCDVSCDEAWKFRDRNGQKYPIFLYIVSIFSLIQRKSTAQ